MPRAGRYRHRVILQQPAGTVDTAGGVSGFTDVATVWAAIEPLRGRERAVSGKFLDEVDALVLLRWRADIQSTWQIKHPAACCGADEYYGIQAKIAPFHIQHKELELPCRRVDTGEAVK